MTKKRRFWIVLLAVLWTAPEQAYASLVTVTGGITSFSSVVLGSPAPGWGAFINGSIVCPDAGCDVSFGPRSMTFATPQQTVDFYVASGVFIDTPNRIQFLPAGEQSVPGPGALFQLGTITFTNGIWTGSADLGFHMESVSSDPALDGHGFDGIIRMRLTAPNLSTNSPEQNADFLELIDKDTGLALRNPLTGLPLPTMRVYERADSPTGSNSGSVSLYGEIGSLFLTGLANPAGGLFLDSSHTLQPNGPNAVPEPSSMLLLAGGLAAIAAHLRRKRKCGSR